MQNSKYHILAILNCTPDSFSNYPVSTLNSKPLSFVDQAQRLIDQGADMIDLGGDSTRPGSLCVDNIEEWLRIAPVLKRFADRIPISVDTHKGEVALRAIDCGAKMINDVTAGRDPLMLTVVANSTVGYTFMFNAYGDAHRFNDPLYPLTANNFIGIISNWALERSHLLDQSGISRDRQIFDPGMGAFISPDPAISRALIDSYWSIGPKFKSRLLGASRKGFLKRPGEREVKERDAESVNLAVRVTKEAPSGLEVLLRVHNVEMHREALDRLALRDDP
jgi:dihydropteroate synthase